MELLLDRLQANKGVTVSFEYPFPKNSDHAIRLTMFYACKAACRTITMMYDLEFFYGRRKDRDEVWWDLLNHQYKRMMSDEEE